MDEQTKKLLADYLAKLLNTADKAAAWTADQIPLVIQEKLAYDFWSDAMIMVMLLVVIGLLIYSCPKLFKSGAEELGVACGCVATIMAPFVIATAMQMTKIALAPRLYILEWLKELVK